MARPSIPLGSYGKISTRKEGAGFLAFTNFRDLDGVLRPVRRVGATRAGAERALKAALTERETPIKAAELVPASKFSKAAELWFAELERLVDAGERSPGTLDTYRYIYGTHVRPALGELRLQEVTTPTVDRVLVAIRKKSASRARSSKIVISGIMRHAARNGAVSTNPVREVGRIESKPKRRPKALTASERRIWLKAVRENELASRWDLPDLTLMMLATGCRIGETLAIGWTEIDLEAGTVDVAWRLVRRRGHGLLRLASTKSGEKGERTIPLPDWAVVMLKARRERIRNDVEPVFPDALGGWRDPTNVRRVWRQIRKKLEMDGMVSHTLRKTVASFLDDANVSTRKISDQLGHAKVSMTQDRYLGRRLTDRQTADVLQEMFPDSEL